MKFSNSKNLSSKIDSKIKDSISKSLTKRENNTTSRDMRSGWRHTGIFQYARYYSTEGVYSVGLGGPPVVGR